MFSVCLPEEKQYFSGGLINHRHAPVYINSQNTLAKRLQHRLALFEQGGDFVGFEPEQNALQNPHQTPNRHRTHKNTEQNGPDGV